MNIDDQMNALGPLMAMAAPDFRTGLLNYFYRGWPPGGYQTPLLVGDEVAALAVGIDAPAFAAFQAALASTAPPGSYGDADKVAAWCAAGGLRARQEAP